MSELFQRKTNRDKLNIKKQDIDTYLTKDEVFYNPTLARNIFGSSLFKHLDSNALFAVSVYKTLAGSI